MIAELDCPSCQSFLQIDLTAGIIHQCPKCNLTFEAEVEPEIVPQLSPSTPTEDVPAANLAAFSIDSPTSSRSTIANKFEPFKPSTDALKNPYDANPSSPRKWIAIGVVSVSCVFVFGVVLFLGSKDNRQTKSENLSKQDGSIELTALPNMTVISELEHRPRYSFERDTEGFLRSKYWLNSGKELSFTANSRLHYNPPSDRFPKEKKLEPVTTAGGCFFIHPRGLAVTNASALDSFDKIEVRIESNWIAAELVAIDTHADIAIINVEVENAPYLAIGNSDKLANLQGLRVLGFPPKLTGGLSATISTASASPLSEELGSSFFVLESPESRTHSGGPIVDPAGQVIGIESRTSVPALGYRYSSVANTDSLRKLLESINVSIPIASADSPDSIRDDDELRSALCRIRVISPGKNWREMSYSVKLNSTATDQNSSFKANQIGLFHGKMLVNDAGRCIETTGKEFAPFLNLSLGKLPFILVDRYNLLTWKISEVELIALPSTTKYFPVYVEKTIETVYPGTADLDYFVTWKICKPKTSVHPEEFIVGQLNGLLRMDKSRKGVKELRLKGSYKFGTAKKPNHLKVDINSFVHPTTGISDKDFDALIKIKNE